MEKLLTLILVLCVIAIIASCGIGQRHTTIVENDNNHYKKIEYAGEVHFNDNGTAIASISHGGYVRYRYDDRKLEAESNGRGGVRYELYDDGHKVDLDENGKRFIAEAVKDMMKKGHNPGNSRF